MTNHSLKALTLAVATVLWQTQVAAAPTNAELNSVKLYGNVTIAQDSVTGWGPWTEFEPPAAGNPPLAALPTTPDLYRTLPQVATATPPGPTPVTPTPERDLIGFGAFYSLITTPNAPDITDGPHPFSLAGTAVTPASTGSWLPDSFEMSITPMVGTSPAPSSSLLAVQADGSYAGGTDTAQLKLIASPGTAVDAQATEASFYQFLSYISSPDERAPQVVTHVGVIGYRSTAADMLDLRGRGVVATYNGQSTANATASFVPMSMRVDFGASTWTGVWNGGVTKNGAIGFAAAGNITGANFNSSSITANDSNRISGTVTGAFFGPMAAAAGGVTDITKSGVRHVDSFLAVKAAPQ